MAMPGISTSRPTRPRFFDRQQLSAADLNAAIEYVRTRQRRHNRFVIGWGVVCGADVLPVDGVPWSVTVGEGYVLTPSGEEIYIPAGAPAFDVCQAARACLNLPGPCPTPDDLSPVEDGTDAADDCIAFPDVNEALPNPLTVGWATFTSIGFDNEPAEFNAVDTFGDHTGLNLQRRASVELGQPADAVRVSLVHTASPCTVRAIDAAGNDLDAQTMSADGGQPQTLRLEGPGIVALDIDAPQNEALLLEICRESAAAVGVIFLAVCPEDEEVCHMPAVPQACLPGDGNLQASRVRERYRLKVLCDLPPSHIGGPSCDQLEQIVCGPDHVPCPPPPAGEDCVVLATLAIGPDGIVAIDPFEHRRRLLPQWVLADLGVCRCQAPLPPTQITVPTTATDLIPRTIPTRFTPFTLLTQFTQLTQPTRFTPFTFITQFTQLTQPTRFTQFTFLTQFSQPTFFTQFTRFSGLTRFTDFVRPSFLVGPARPGGEIGGGTGEAPRGRAIPIEEISGIGPTLSERLRKAGIETVADFAALPPVRAAAIMRLSEVRVAGLQERARAIIGRPE
jgi:hypothetical protein